MGKLAKPAREEVLKASRGCCYYADHAAAILAEEDIPTEATRSYIRYEPMGADLRDHAVELPVLAGLPLRRACALAGNGARPEAYAQRAAVRAGDRSGVPPWGYPEGVFQSLLIEVEQVSGDSRRSARRRR